MHRHFDALAMAPAIQARVRSIGKWITDDYREASIDAFTLVAILQGAAPFAMDLSRAIDVPHTWDFLRVSTYEGRDPARDPAIPRLESSVQGRYVLLVDDIMDTGSTMEAARASILAQGAAFVETAVVINNLHRRSRTIRPDRAAFSVSTDRFFVGYGMDLNGTGRHLPDLCMIEDTP